MFQNEYRQVNENSSFIADFGVTKGYQSSITGSRNSIGHLFAKFEKDFEFENFETSDLTISLESVTNDTFLNVFRNNLIKSSVKPNSLNSLESGIDFYLDNEDYNFSTGLEVYESLSEKTVIDISIVFRTILIQLTLQMKCLVELLVFLPLVIMF